MTAKELSVPQCQVQSSMSGSPVADKAGTSTWQMIAALCPTALGALSSQLTFQLT